MKTYTKDFCKKHKPMNKKLGYLAHHNWMDEMVKKGEKQKQCPKCGRWLFNCEY